MPGKILIAPCCACEKGVDVVAGFDLSEEMANDYLKSYRDVEDKMTASVYARLCSNAAKEILNQCGY